MMIFMPDSLWIEFAWGMTFQSVSEWLVLTWNGRFRSWPRLCRWYWTRLEVKSWGKQWCLHGSGEAFTWQAPGYQMPQGLQGKNRSMFIFVAELEVSSQICISTQTEVLTLNVTALRFGKIVRDICRGKCARVKRIIHSVPFLQSSKCWSHTVHLYICKQLAYTCSFWKQKASTSTSIPLSLPTQLHYRLEHISTRLCLIFWRSFTHTELYVTSICILLPKKMQIFSGVFWNWIGLEH